MNDIDVEAWLTQEVDDLLAEGPVGLYEFVWRLNGSAYRLEPAEARRVSRDVARRVLATGQAQLFGVEWPSFAIVTGPMDESVLDDSASWSEGETGPLVALIPSNEIDEHR
jgi:hypothetical protein